MSILKPMETPSGFPGFLVFSAITSSRRNTSGWVICCRTPREPDKSDIPTTIASTPSTLSISSRFSTAFTSSICMIFQKDPSHFFQVLVSWHQPVVYGPAGSITACTLWRIRTRGNRPARLFSGLDHGKHDTVGTYARIGFANTGSFQATRQNAAAPPACAAMMSILDALLVQRSVLPVNPHKIESRKPKQLPHGAFRRLDVSPQNSFRLESFPLSKSTCPFFLRQVHTFYSAKRDPAKDVILQYQVQRDDTPWTRETTQRQDRAHAILAKEVILKKRQYCYCFLLQGNYGNSRTHSKRSVRLSQRR